jgi:hypothetical protein
MGFDHGNFQVESPLSFSAGVPQNARDPPFLRGDREEITDGECRLVGSHRCTACRAARGQYGIRHGASLRTVAVKDASRPGLGSEAHHASDPEHIDALHRHTFSGDIDRRTEPARQRRLGRRRDGVTAQDPQTGAETRSGWLGDLDVA